jgi:hypothetical protein
MTNELEPCGRARCFINGALKRGVRVIWPQHCSTESNKLSYYFWAFYVKWEDGTRGHANGKEVCPWHHKQLIKIWQAQLDDDVRTEEATEAWLSRHNNRMIVL